MNYDRLYDMAYLRPLTSFVEYPCKPTTTNIMRETGVEPASLAAPDPKSHDTPKTGAAPSDASPPAATQRHGKIAGLRPIVRHEPANGSARSSDTRSFRASPQGNRQRVGGGR